MEEKDDFQTQLGFRIVQCIHDTQYKCAVYSHRFGFNLLAQYLLFIKKDGLIIVFIFHSLLVFNVY